MAIFGFKKDELQAAEKEIVKNIEDFHAEKRKKNKSH